MFVSNLVRAARRGLTGGIAGAALLALPIATPVHAQDQDDSTEHQLREVMSVLEWREIGPTIMGGRIADLAVDENHPSTFYVGTAGGGVWKTTSGGIDFAQVFDDPMTSTIGDVTLAPSNPNVVWVGTGEPQNRQSSSWGNGVYRSVDAGRTWTHLGLEDTHHIARIQVHPMNPDVAYVAAMGHLWGPNEDRGVFRTTDGGQTWEKVLYVDENTGAIDLIMDPNDPMTLFAAMYQRQRRAWGYNGGGPGSGIYRTLDGGENWAEMTEGLPQGDKGRIGLDIYRGNSDWIYAIVEADGRAPGQGRSFGGDASGENGVYRSRDRGETWEKTSDTNNRPMYYSQIRVDPNDSERVYTGGSSLYRSSDGGHNFTNDASDGVHSDHHALWIDPNDSDHLILGSDGGVSVSWNRSDSWYQLRNVPVSQFYEIGVDMRQPYHVCGGLQDNGSWCAPSDTWSNQGIRTRDWYNVGGGDGFFTVMHPSNPRVMFSESQGGNVNRVDMVSMERQSVRPDAVDQNGESLDQRRNWNSPIIFSPHGANRIYFASNYLFRSDDLGTTWERISDELSYAIDRESIEIMGVLGSAEQISLNDGQSNYGNVTAIGESPVNENILYTGSDDGRLMRTMDGGGSWTDVTGNVPGLPANTYVTRIVASHAAAGTVVAAFDGHRADDYAAYVFRSTDNGNSWTRITNGLPEESVNALAQHPRAANLWFVGNERGIYVSLNGGDEWFMMDGLPTVPVDDIKIQARENDLVIGTHGRGIWIMDDITPLENLGPQAMMADVQLFGIQNTVSYNSYNPQGWTPGIFESDNPDDGAGIRFQIGQAAAAAADEYTITIADANGNTVRVLTDETEPGVHQVNWDLRLTQNGSDGEAMDPGPRVMPGRYTASLTVGTMMATGTSSFEVLLDPRVEISAADQRARYAAMMSSYQLSGPAQAANQRLDQAGDQLEEAADRVEAADGNAALMARIEAAQERLDELDDLLGDASDGAGAWGGIQRMHVLPTAQTLESIERSWADLPGVIGQVNQFISGDLRQVTAAAAAVAALAPNDLDTVPLPTRGGGL